MKKILLYSACAVMMLVASCKKDAPDFTGYDVETGTGVEQPVLSDNYQPTAKGTTWKYNVIVPGLGADVSTVTMSGTTKTFNGKVYQAGTTTYKNKTTADEVFFYNLNGSFSERDVTDGDTSEILYLKTNAAVNETWSADLFNDGTGIIDTRAIGKLVAKDQTKTVSGKTFKNVYHTHIDLQSTSFGSPGTTGGEFQTFSTVDYYIAKGVGIIQTDVTAFGIAGSSKITDYTIK